MVVYSLAQNRTASDMDGVGTDLASKDTVTTNAFMLTMDIDCCWKKITVSNGGTLEVEGHVYEIDDDADAGIEAQTGSDIKPKNMSETSFAVFKSASGEGVMPLFPWSFTVKGTLDLPYTVCHGHKWSMRNAAHNLELPLGCAKILLGKTADIVQNSIQGGDAVIKFTGRRVDGFTLTALLFNDYENMVGLLTEMEEAGDLFSVITDRFFVESVLIGSLNVRNEAKDLVTATIGLLVQGG